MVDAKKLEAIADAAREARKATGEFIEETESLYTDAELLILWVDRRLAQAFDGLDPATQEVWAG